VPLGELPDASTSSSGKPVIVACSVITQLAKVCDDEKSHSFFEHIVTLIFKLSSFRSISISEIRIFY
jgi:hypothetical protein